MAYTKIHAIKSTLNKAIAYIEDPLKTDGEVLVYGYNVDPQYASTEFAMTEALSREIKGDNTKIGGGNNLAYHMMQSFSPTDDITPEQAHELGKQWADEVLGGKYEYVISTHIDKGHIHNHVIVNATSFYDYGKFETVPYKTVQRLREVSDRLCAEYGISVIKQAKGKGKSHFEWEQNRKGTSWKSKLKKILDEAIAKTESYNEFKQFLQERGVEVKEGAHIAFRLPEAGQEKFIRGKTIGEGYTREALLESVTTKPKTTKQNVTFEKRVEREAQHTSLAQTKELAAALLTIRREGIQSESGFEMRISELQVNAQSVADTIKTLEEKNLQYKDAAKYLLAVQKYLPIIEASGHQSAATKKRFEKKNESELLAYSHAVERLAKLGVNTNVDPEKVIALVKTQDEKVSGLTTSFREVESRIEGIRNAQRVYDRINQERASGQEKKKERGQEL